MLIFWKMSRIGGAKFYGEISFCNFARPSEREHTIKYQFFAVSTNILAWKIDMNGKWNIYNMFRTISSFGANCEAYIVYSAKIKHIGWIHLARRSLIKIFIMLDSIHQWWFITLQQTPSEPLMCIFFFFFV